MNEIFLYFSNYNFSTDGFATLNTNGSLVLGGGGVRGGVDWMRKLAFRYRKIKEVYIHYKNNPGGLFPPKRREDWQRVRQDIEAVTDSWHTEAMKCLNYIYNK